MRETKGITLIALVITIIVLLILAGVAISMLSGENGILTKASYAKFATEVKNIEEEIELKYFEMEPNYSGSVYEILGKNTQYDKKLYVEDGKLVYIESKVSKQEKEWLDKLGIPRMSDYFTVEFDSSGAQEIASQTIKAGNKVEQPENPSKTGHEFLGWYYLEVNEETEEATEILFDFNTEIMKPYFLYAKYSGEAVMMYRSTSKAFWQSDYKTKITSIEFLKKDLSTMPEDVQYWNIKADNNCADIYAYVEDNEDGETYKLTVISPLTIYANPFAAFYFQGFTALTSINLENFDTSRVSSMMSMFRECTSLETLSVSNFDVRKVQNFASMFYGSSNLTSLDLSSFKTESATDMKWMFQNCTKLESLVLSNFNTSKVTSMESMFRDCIALTSLDVSKFVTTNVKSMYGMFSGCKKVETLDVSNFDTSKVKNMRINVCRL